MKKSILFFAFVFSVAQGMLLSQSDTLDFATINSFSLTNTSRTDTLKLSNIGYQEVVSTFGPATTERHLDGSGPTGVVWDQLCYGTSCINISNVDELSWIEINSPDLLLLAYGKFELQVGHSIEDLKPIFPHAFDTTYTTPDETTDHHAMISFFQKINGVYHVTDHAVYVSFDPASKLITEVIVDMAR